MRNQIWHGGIVLAGVILIIAATPGCCATRTAGGPAPAGKYVSQAVEGTPVALQKTWNGSRDVYLDIRRAKEPIDTSTGTANPHPNDFGYRVIFGPNPQGSGGGPAGPATLASEDVSTPAGTETIALVDVDGGYAALWGYKPRVRMRRIVAGSDGTTIIVQYRAADDVHRVYVLDKADPAKKVSVYNESDGAVLYEWTENDTYVDFTPGPIGTTPEWGTPTKTSTDPQAQAFVDAVRAKMK
jgi:hypothetical protein